MENNYLDKRIRELIEGLEDSSGSHWEQMEQMLNSPANADLSENQLDHGLRSKLDELEPEFNNTHWNLFEQRLDAEVNTPDMEDVYLDGVSYELLNEFQVPYNPDHWPIMENRLDEEFSLRHKLVKYKVAELALLAIVLFTIVQFLPLEKISTFRLPLVQQIAPSTKSLSSELPSAANQDNSANQPSIAQNKEQASKVAAVFPATQTESNALASPSNIATELVVTTAAEQVVIVSSSTKQASSANTAKGSATQIPLLPTVEQIPSTLSNKLASKELGILNDQKIVANNTASENIEEVLSEHISIIPTINGLGLRQLAAKDPDLLDLDCKGCDIWKAPSFLRIGMLGAGELNYVMTPYNEDYNRPGTNSYETGYGGGLTLGFKFGRWEIETGAIYANKFYNPDTLSATINSGNFGQGYVGIGWKGTELDVLRIPLRVRYDVTRMGKWHLYGQGGVAMNLTMNRIHYHEVVQIGGDPLLPPESTDFDLRGGSENEETRKPDYGSVNESVGLLKSGGTFKNNNYVSFELGIGIERFLSSRFSIFTQPTFNTQFLESSIGLNNERINTLSIEAGVRVSLKKTADHK